MAGQVGVPGLSQAANTAVNDYDNTRMAEGKQLIGGRKKRYVTQIHNGR